MPDDTDELWVLKFRALDDRDFMAAIETWIDTQSRPFWPSVNELHGIAASERRKRETASGCGECTEGLRYGEKDDGVRYMYPCPCPAGAEKRRWLSGEKDYEAEQLEASSNRRELA